MGQPTKRGEERWNMIMARAWAEPAFMRRLLEDPASVLRDYSFSVPANATVRVIVQVKHKDGHNDNMPIMTKEQASELSDAQLESVAGGTGPSRFQVPKNLALLDTKENDC